MGIGEHVGEGVGEATGTTGFRQNSGFLTSPSLTDGASFVIPGSFGTRTITKDFFELFNNGTGDGDTVLASQIAFDAINHSPKYRSDARGGAFSVDTVVTVGQQGDILKRNGFTESFEVAYSYACKVPAGFTFPGTTKTAYPLDGTPVSVLKMSWLITGTGGTALDDYINVSKAQNTTNPFYQGGNGTIQSGLELIGSATTADRDKIFSFDEWNSHYVAIRQLGTPGVGNVRTYHRMVNSNGMLEFTKDLTATQFYETDGLTTGGWRNLNIHGWQQPAISGNRWQVADVSLYLGAHSNCRVEIGNNPTYGNCTAIAVQELATWNGSLTGTVRRGGFGTFTGGPYYFFVHDFDNTLVTSGII